LSESTANKVEIIQHKISLLCCNTATGLQPQCLQHCQC